MLGLPFYWDELGQFVPAALDILYQLAWVPFSTTPNVHPPGVMSYLALVWSLFGFSVAHTRVAMLALAACALAAQWRLARVLSASEPAAWLATAFLFCSPLFFSQAEMAQLDMPAMLLTSVAFILFFEERMATCALVCCVAVLAKETAVLAPALFGFLLLRRRNVRQALLFVTPLIPLCIWLAVLRATTGHLFGNSEFTDYNLFYPLNPVRLGLALLRRIYYLLIGSGHILGLAAVVFWLRRGSSLSLKWRIAFVFVSLHVVLISVLGGAVLERYLMPALPILYATFAAAITAIKGRMRYFLSYMLPICLLTACVVNPPYPFPMENNLAWTTFVTLQKEGSSYVENVIPGAVVATTFPYAGGLRRPELGYVRAPQRVLEITDFRAKTLEQKVPGHAAALMFYSIQWDPMELLQRPWFSGVLTRFYGYAPAATAEEIPALTGMRQAFRLCAAGQCVDIFRASGDHSATPVGAGNPALGNVDRRAVIK